MPPAAPAISHHPSRILITGGAGFIGCNLVRHLLDSCSTKRLVVLDALTYASSLPALEAASSGHGERFRFVEGDICVLPLVAELLSTEAINTIVHLAAESHVDRSIDDPLAFVRTNVMGTATLLQAARVAWHGRHDGVRFHHVSTDEVFGSLGPDGAFSESTPYDPSSPYSASKAGSDHLVRAWYRTYGLPVTISNCSNNYGPWQFPEKLIPLMILKALAGESLPVYGAGANVRDWLHVEDHCRAISVILRTGRPGSTYCVGGGNEMRNLDLVRLLCTILDQEAPSSEGPHRRLITHVLDRPGHDLRYAIDPTLIRDELGWTPRIAPSDGLRSTVHWYLEHQHWLKAISEQRYQGQRLGAPVRAMTP